MLLAGGVLLHGGGQQLGLGLGLLQQQLLLGRRQSELDKIGTNSWRGLRRGAPKASPRL